MCSLRKDLVLQKRSPIGSAPEVNVGRLALPNSVPPAHRDDPDGHLEREAHLDGRAPHPIAARELAPGIAALWVACANE